MPILWRGFSRVDLPCNRTWGLVAPYKPSYSCSRSRRSSSSFSCSRSSSSSSSSSSFKTPSSNRGFFADCSYLRFSLHAQRSQGPLGAPQCPVDPQLLGALQGRTDCWRKLKAAVNDAAAAAASSSSSRIGSSSSINRCIRIHSSYTSSSSRIGTTSCSSSSNMKGSIRGHSSSSSSSSKDSSSSSSNNNGTYVVRVPSLGDSITEGTVAKWLAAEGSAVHAEQVLCVLETDKVSVEIAAKAAGRLIHIAVPVGGNVSVGGELAVIERLAPSPAASAAAAAAADAPPAAAPQAAAAAAAAEGAPAALAADPLYPRRRTPSILFRTVRNKLERLGLLVQHQQQQQQAQREHHLPLEQQQQHQQRQQQQQGAAAGASPPSSAGGPRVTVVRYTSIEELPPFLQRPALSPEEVEVINEGGVANADNAVRAWTVSLCFTPAAAAAAAAAGSGGGGAAAAAGGKAAKKRASS